MLCRDLRTLSNLHQLKVIPKQPDEKVEAGKMCEGHQSYTLEEKQLSVTVQVNH